MNLLTLFQAELDGFDIAWCQACDAKNSHHRGFADPKKRTIHLDRKISTRSTLHRALHEVGHIVNNETGLLRWEKEQRANDFAELRMRDLGIPLPRAAVARGRAYVRRMKRWGKAISKGRKSDD